MHRLKNTSFDCFFSKKKVTNSALKWATRLFVFFFFKDAHNMRGCGSSYLIKNFFTPPFFSLFLHPGHNQKGRVIKKRKKSIHGKIYLIPQDDNFFFQLLRKNAFLFFCFVPPFFFTGQERSFVFFCLFSGEKKKIKIFRIFVFFFQDLSRSLRSLKNPEKKRKKREKKMKKILKIFFFSKKR